MTSHFFLYLNDPHPKEAMVQCQVTKMLQSRVERRRLEAAAQLTNDQLMIPPIRLDSAGQGWEALANNNNNSDLQKTYESGKMEAEITKLLSEHFVGLNPIVAFLVRKKFKSIDLAGFCVHWLPGGDLRAAKALAALAASGWIADDLFDGMSNSKEAMVQKQLIAKTWMLLPDLIQREYLERLSFEEVLRAVNEDIHQACVSLDGKAVKLSPILRAHNSLLVYSLVSLRYLCRSEELFLYFGEEMRQWMSNNVNKQVADVLATSTSSLDRLKKFRLVDGGFKFVLVFCLAASGEAIDVAAFDNASVSEAIDHSGLHLAFLNDIFSYHKDMKEIGAEANLVEHLRVRYCDANLDKAMEKAVNQVNDSMLCFNRIASELADSPQHNAILDCCLRQIIGNIHWSLRNNRYSNKVFVASRCSLLHLVMSSKASEQFSISFNEAQ